MEVNAADIFSSSTSVTSSQSVPNPIRPDEDGVSFRSHGGNLASIPASVRSSQYFSSGTYISSVCPPETCWVPENFSEFLESAFSEGSLNIPHWEDSDSEEDFKSVSEFQEDKQEHSLSADVDKDRPLFTSWHAISAENRFIVIPRPDEDGVVSGRKEAELDDQKKGVTQNVSEYDSVQSNSSTKELLASAARKIASDDSAYDSVQSSSSTRGLLASAARKFVLRSKGPSQYTVRPNDEAKLHMRKSSKNLAALCIGYSLSFLAFFALRNIQSSLSSDSSLVMLSLSIVYCTFVVSCVFSRLVVEKLGCKYTIMAGQLGIAIYTACNFYPVAYIIIPASVLLGFCFPNMWVAHGLYLTGLATSHSTWSGKSKASAIRRFNGVFFSVWHGIGVLGNLATSLIFYPRESARISSNESVSFSSAMYQSLSFDNRSLEVVPTNNGGNFSISPFGTNISLCGANFCHHYGIEDSTGQAKDPVTVKIFLGVFLAVCLCGVAVVGIFLDNTLAKTGEGSSTLKQKMIGLFRHLKDRRALMLLALVFYLGIQQVFIYGEITKAFVSCPYGIYKIGFLMISHGLFDAISCLLTSHLQKHLGRAVVCSIAAILNLSVLLTALCWQPTVEQEYVVYILAALWGLADGIWGTMTNSMVGILFMDTMKSAFASTRQVIALGSAVAFAYSQYLCMTAKIGITMGVLVVAVAGYGMLELKLTREAKTHLQGKTTCI